MMTSIDSSAKWRVESKSNSLIVVLCSSPPSCSELHAKVEGMEEQFGRQKQLLREATAKYQNLMRHLKLIQAESARVLYDDTSVPHSTEELHR